MKRINSSESLGVIVSMCPTRNDEGTSKNNNGYSKEFQAMLDRFDDEEEEGTNLTTSSKKRRLSFEIVKALDKYFEVNKKLEPERKAKIAEELGLQPRQVAIWFQNRRARWKTKQLERDFGYLRSDYDDLRRSYELLEHESQVLSAELSELKSKLQDKNNSKKQKQSPVKEEAMFSEQSKISPGGFCGESEPSVLEFKNQIEFKDGSSDSDSNEMFFDADFQNPQQWIYQSQFGMVGEHSIYGITEELCGLLDHSKNMHWYNLDN